MEQSLEFLQFYGKTYRNKDWVTTPQVLTDDIPFKF